MNVFTSIDRLPPYKIPNYITSPRTMSFKAWLRSPVMDASDSNDGNYKKHTCINGDWYTHNDYILDFIDGLMRVIHASGYNIENEKQFKHEIAIFIYRLSREKL